MILSESHLLVQILLLLRQEILVIMNQNWVPVKLLAVRMRVVHRSDLLRLFEAIYLYASHHVEEYPPLPLNIEPPTSLVWLSAIVDQSPLKSNLKLVLPCLFGDYHMVI